MKPKQILAIAALAGMMVAAGSSAYATEYSAVLQEDSDIIYTPVKQTTEKIMIDGETTDIAVMPDFDSKAPAVVLDANGQPISADVSIINEEQQVEELSVVSSTDKDTLASCWRGWVAPGTGTWITSIPGCSIIGTAPSTSVYYGWTVDNGNGCLQGRGYAARHLPGGGYAYDEYFPSLGCGVQGSNGGGYVNWGEVASTKQVKARTSAIPVGASGMFK